MRRTPDVGDVGEQDHSPPAPTGQATGKLPYEAPAVLSEETFETTALTCLKLDAGCDPDNNS